MCLKAGAKVMSSLQRYARVPCGYAAVKDVRTSQHEDQMDSFVLSETFKYLYLLFSSPEDLPLQVDDFVFTTEAHLLPLSLARLSNLTSVPLRSQEQEDERNLVEDFDVEHARLIHLPFWPYFKYFQAVVFKRNPLHSAVEVVLI